MSHLNETYDVPQLGHPALALRPQASMGDGHFNGDIEINTPMATNRVSAQPSNQNSVSSNQDIDRPQRRRPGRKPKYSIGQAGSDADDSFDENGVAIDPKRRARLVRNRISAGKARVKRKDEEDALVWRETTLEESCKHLSLVLEQLQEERKYFQQRVREHAQCGSASITTWINGIPQAGSITYETMGHASAHQVQPASPGLVYSSGVSPAESFTSETSNAGDVQTPWLNYVQTDITNPDSIHDSMMAMNPQFLPQPMLGMDSGASMSAMMEPPNDEEYERRMMDTFNYQEEESDLQWHFSG